MEASEYIDKMNRNPTHGDFQPSGITKELYLDVIEAVIDGYGRTYFEKVISGEEKSVVCIVLRAAGALSYLLSAGRKQDYYDIWRGLMDKSCELLTLPYENVAEFDLSVQEVMISMKLMRGRVPADEYGRWYGVFAHIDPFGFYGCQSRNASERSNPCNMTVYNMAGEYLRETEGMTDTDAYFDKNLPWVLSRFDENGMFVDNDSAMLYDLSVRCRLAIMLHYGYDKKAAAEFDSFLEKAGIMTLMMQSSGFQLPYGGRSNQYLFNECLVASCCEFEAVRYKKRGDDRLAGMFKRCARLSAASILRWLNYMYPPKHNKNFFYYDNDFGIDVYGTYPRYLITIACFIGYAYLFADETIGEYECPCETGGYVICTSASFHKVMATCLGNTVELELGADPAYDSTGCGRYHKAGVPVELGLSMPFTATPQYYLPDSIGRRDISICAGFRAADGEIVFISDLREKVQTEVKIIAETYEKTVFSVMYRSLPGSDYPELTETYILDEDGVTVKAELSEVSREEIFFTVPLLKHNGRDTTRLEVERHCASVMLDPKSLAVSSDGCITILPEDYGNRNGIYNLALIQKQDRKITVHMSLK